jgi:hypothetical protein
MEEKAWYGMVNYGAAYWAGMDVYYYRLVNKWTLFSSHLI